MIYPSIDKLLNVIDSKYTLVTIAANRSREIKRTGFLQMPQDNYKSAIINIKQELLIISDRNAGVSGIAGTRGRADGKHG